MRKSLLMIGIPVSVVGLGLATFFAVRSTPKCPADSLADELKQADAAGIQLAQSQTAKQFAFSETAPEAKPEAATVTKRGNGPKAVRSNTPTVKAAPEAVAADVVEEIPDLSVVQTSAAPTPVEAPAPSIPRPAPATEPAPSEDNGAILRGGTGAGNGRTGSGGGGGGWGTIFGAVIRGGGVDGDNCDPRGGRARPQTRAPIYGQNPVYGQPSAPVGTGRTAGSVIRGGGVQLPVGIAGSMGTASRPRR